MPGFSAVKQMFHAHDGYALTIEADFLRAKRDQAFCLREVGQKEGIVALCGQRNSVLNLPFPVTPHALTEYQFENALETKLGKGTA